MDYFQTLKKIWNSKKGTGITDKLLGLVICAVLAAALLPIAITQLANINTTVSQGSGVANITWGAGETALVGLLPVFVIIGIVVMIIGYAISKKY